MKKYWLIILVVVVVAVIAIASTTLILLRGKEDGWICNNGEWVKHGNPSAAMPLTACTEENKNKSCYVMDNQCCKNNSCSEVNIVCELGKEAVFIGCSSDCTTQMECVPKQIQARACTMEAKICPDGSAVGRGGSNCEFDPCPGDDVTSVGLANPASVNCQKKGGTPEIITATDGSQSGICKFTDGSQCEEWAYMRGECQPGLPTQESVILIVKQLIANKYQRDLAEVSVTINKQTANHLRGGVMIGSNTDAGGGIFLAAKVNNKWQLVFDGNGQINCSLVAPYGFPANMISDCAR